MTAATWLLRPWVRPVVLALALAPLAGWIWGIATSSLGPNPAEALLRGTGLWTLRLLIITLAITPLRLWFGLPALARWRRMFEINVFGTLLCAQAAGRLMVKRRWGRIVNVTSGIANEPELIAYAVSKAGLIHLTRCMAVALAPHTLVNCVALRYDADTVRETPSIVV